MSAFWNADKKFNCLLVTCCLLEKNVTLFQSMCNRRVNAEKKEW